MYLYPRILAIFLVVTSACGGDTSSEVIAPFASGARLRAIYYDGGEGATQLRAWRDTELGIDCRFMDDGTGMLRCLPSAAANVVYLDAGCSTDPVVFQFQCPSPAPPSMITEPAGVTCDGTAIARAYSVGSTTTTRTLYSDQPSGCQRVDYTEDQLVYRLSAAPAASFVVATPRDIPVDDELSLRVFETAGGAHEARQVVARAHQEVCSWTSVGDDWFCVPRGLASESDTYHSSGTCTSADIASSSAHTDCPAPVYGVSSRFDGCNTTGSTLVEMGSEVTAAQVYAGQEGACFLAPADLRYWSVRGPATELPPRLSRTDIGSGRLRVAYTATEQGTPLLPHLGWYDQDQSCFFFSTESQGLRCVGGYLTDEHHYFRDASCLEPVVRVTSGTCGAGSLPELHIRLESNGRCAFETLHEVREVGGAHSGAVYSDISGQCAMHQPASNESFYQLGASVPLDSFPAVVEKQE